MSENIPTRSTPKNMLRINCIGNAATVLVAAGYIILAASQVASSAPVPTPKPRAASTAPSPVARGEYLVRITGCDDCHTPLKMGPQGLQPDLSRMLSGHPDTLKMPPPPTVAGPWIWMGSGTNTAFAGPWGITYATNLTPEENTGMGSIWKESMFIAAMRTGKHMGTLRPIMPPMPCAAYGQMTDDDLKAIYAYLRTVQPIKNLVPAYEPRSVPTKP